MSMEEWDAVEEVCKVLKVSFHHLASKQFITELTWFIHGLFQIFYSSTKQMEGDFASGSVVLAEYLRITEVLQQLRDASNFPNLINMIDTMLVKFAVYQYEAASSDVIVLANVMNPKYRLKFFDLHYPKY